MIIEYSSYDISLSDDELRANLKQAIAFQPSTISVLPPHTKLAKNILPSTILLSCALDYPLGLLDSKNRTSTIETCIKNGAQIINLVAQPHNFCNRKYEKFRDDIRSNNELCLKYGVELRYILEYRVFTYELLYKVSQILLDLGVNTIYPSTGYLLDDINDNILAAGLINKKVPINIICNGNIWNISQINMLKKTTLYGVMVNSINALDLATKK
jgi:deoxyribose-phosphate aldolase